MRATSVLLLLAGVGAASSAAAAGNFFCCTDDHGKQVCGDILPSVCIGRAYREISPNGTSVRSVEAPLTAEQKAQRAAEQRRRDELEAAQREQRRRDEALLQTYANLDDIEFMRRRAESDVLKAIQAAEAKIAEARQTRKRFEDEAEFYKKKALPPEIDKGLKGADYEIAAQQGLIDAKRKELETIKAKYDEDRRRFLDLTARQR